MQPPLIGFGNLKRRFSSGVEFRNGVEFRDGNRYLHFQGQVIAEGVLPGDFEPYAYFYNLRFLDDFPAIQLWAFGDAWTQRIKVQRPRNDQPDQLFGWVCFGDDESRAPYVIERAYDWYPMRAYPLNVTPPTPPWVQAPLPPLFDIAINIPLRLIVTRAVLAALDDNWPYDQWQFVTSMVPREQVPQVIVQDVAVAYGFRLRGYPINMRQALCDFQGLRT